VDQSLDEYGHRGRVSGVHWATAESVLPDKNLHVDNTRVGPGGSVGFWMRQPRPQGVSPQDWEQITQNRWDRIFGPKE
jgi:hypothetical protein